MKFIPNFIQKLQKDRKLNRQTKSNKNLKTVSNKKKIIAKIGSKESNYDRDTNQQIVNIVPGNQKYGTLDSEVNGNYYEFYQKLIKVFI